MANYLITYDLRAPGRNYEKLYELLVTAWRSQPVAESVWLAELTGSAEQVRDVIKQHCDPNDRVVVFELMPGAEWAASWGIPAGLNWLLHRAAAHAAAA